MTRDEEIRDLAKAMRRIARRYGPLHSWWDVIFDMEAFVKGQPTIVQRTADEWLVYGRELLSRQSVLTLAYDL